MRESICRFDKQLRSQFPIFRLAFSPVRVRIENGPPVNIFDRAYYRELE